MNPVSLTKVKNLNRYQRKQTKLQFSNLYPKPTRKGQCRCGCKRKVRPPKRFWARKQCSDDAGEYFFLIKGYTSTVRRLVFARDAGYCAQCSVHCWHDGWEADHILEVVRGGGGCDLSNYQTLCKPCHLAKTKRLMESMRNG